MSTRTKLARERFEQFQTELETIQEQRLRAEAALLRGMLLDVADEYPRVEGFSYFAHYEYNDEGGSDLFVEPQVEIDGETYGQDDAYEIEDGEGIAEALNALGYVSPEAFARAFRNKYADEDGAVSVETLRAPEAG